MPVLGILWGGNGDRSRLIAWILRILSACAFLIWKVCDGMPVKCTRQDQVIVDGDFIEAFMKVLLIDESTRLADNDERKDDPESHQPKSTGLLKKTFAYISFIISALLHIEAMGTPQHRSSCNFLDLPDSKILGVFLHQKQVNG
jgi:hypothetical protein